MKFLAQIGFSIAVLAGVSLAQFVRARPAYWPHGYDGTAFSGRVVSLSEQNELSLAFVDRKKKIISFKGRFEQTCGIPLPNNQMRAASETDFPPGTPLTAYFEKKMSKIDGKKISENIIIAISFQESEGEKIPVQRRVVIYCTHPQLMKWKVFRR